MRQLSRASSAQLPGPPVDPAARGSASRRPRRPSATHKSLGRERVHPVFLLDELHLLHQEVLDPLHILLNYQWDSRAPLSLVLLGLPELADRLELRRNRSLSSRMARRLRIDPLTPADTAEYLRLRLRRAGCECEVFSSDAMSMLHEAASGAHRDLDRLATAALRESARRRRSSSGAKRWRASSTLPAPPTRRRAPISERAARVPPSAMTINQSPHISTRHPASQQ